MDADDERQDRPAKGLSLRRLAIPAWFRGYRALTILGRAPTGPVYSAISLTDGQPRLLRAVRPDWGADATYAAGLAREVLAATHLRHPNLERVDEVIALGGTLVVVSERVPGTTLDEVIAARTRLEPRDAAVAILQVARGIKVAHDAGLRHRQVTLSRMVLGRNGHIKLLGLGLLPGPEVAAALDRDEQATARRTAAPRSTDIRGASPPGDADVEAGSPLDRDEIDRLEDIAALGRSLRVLATGRSAAEGDLSRMSGARLPADLDAIVGRMSAEGSEPRYLDTGEAIAALERYLGVDGSRPLAPDDELTEAVANASEGYLRPPSARLRNGVLLGSTGLTLLFVILNLLAGWSILALGFLGLGLFTAGVFAIATGLRKPTALLGASRALMVESLLAEPLGWLVGLALLGFGLWAFGLIGTAVAFAIAAVLLVVSFHLAIEKRYREERRLALEPIAGRLQALRLHGYGEPVLQALVRDHAGMRWEPMFEALFGHDALRHARRRGVHPALGDWFKPATWRDSLVGRLHRLRRTLKASRLRRLLETLEERKSCARGVNLLTARRRGWRVAEALMTVDAELRATTTASPDVARALREAALNPETVLVEHEVGLATRPHRRGHWLEPVLRVLFGPRTRFLAGAALAAGCLVWMHQNDLMPGQEVRDLAARAVEIRDIEAARELGEAAGKVKIEVPEATTPLRLPPLPSVVTAPLGSPDAGVAGLVLIASSLFPGWRMGLFMIPAALLAILGPAGLSLPLAGVIALAGFLFGRGR